MAKQKTVVFRSDAEGPITVHTQVGEPIVFEPGKVRTYETDNADEIAALRGNADLTEEKKK